MAGSRAPEPGTALILRVLPHRPRKPRTRYAGSNAWAGDDDVRSLLATLEPEYEVRSNRESGKGRPDVMLRPKQAGKPGAVLELKVAKTGRKTLEQALAEGVARIEERDYASELRAAGASPVYGFAVAFDGKHVKVAGV